MPGINVGTYNACLRFFSFFFCSQFGFAQIVGDDFNLQFEAKFLDDDKMQDKDCC
jgi:hypothetical protein